MRKSQPLNLLDVDGPRLSVKWGGARKLGAGYFCIFFVLPPVLRTSILCCYPRCPDFNKCCKVSGPSRIVYDRVLEHIK